MANVKISDLAPAQLPLDLPNTLFEVQTFEAGIPVSRKITGDDLTVQGTITVEDEGTPLATGADTLNFTGAGVTASGTGTTKTINIPGGGGGATSLQDAYDGGNTILIDGVPNPVIFNASVSGSMFELYDTSSNLIFQVIDTGVIAGNPGLEGAGVLINGVLYDSVFKASEIGSTNIAQTILHRHSTTFEPLVVAARAQGDTDAHIIVNAGDPLLSILATGWDGTSYAISSDIQFRVDGTPGLDDMPGLIAFSTTPSGAEVTTERVRIRETGLTEFDYPIDFLERPAALGTVPAGRGQLWVRDDTPNVLVFTDDAGTDFVLNAGGGGGVNSVTAGTNLNDTGSATDPILNLDDPITLGQGIFTDVSALNLVDADVALVVAGTGASVHLEIGRTSFGTGIQAKSDLTTPDLLELNRLGGDVRIGSQSTAQASTVQLWHSNGVTGSGPVIETTVSGFIVEGRAGSSTIIDYHTPGGNLVWRHAWNGANFQIDGFSNGSEFRINGRNTAAQTREFIHMDPDVEVEIFHPGSDESVFQTLPAASGGLQVNNTLTGAGFERVLTTSDSAGGTPPGGASTNIQYNNAGSFDGDAEFTWNTVQGQLRLTHSQPGGSGRDCFIIDVNQPSAAALVINTNQTGPNEIIQLNPDTGSAGINILANWTGADTDHFLRIDNQSGGVLADFRRDGFVALGFNDLNINQGANPSISLQASTLLEFAERTSANPATSGVGQLWVRDDTPNVLVFTDDTGTDTVLGGGGGGVNSVTAGTNLNNSGTANDPVLNVDDPLIISSINATSALQSNTSGSPYLNVPLNIGANLVGTQGMTQYTRQFIQARPSSFGYNSTLFINERGEPGTNGANTFIGGLNSAGIEVDFGVEVNLRHGVAPGNSAPVMSTFARGIKLPQGSIYVTQTASPGANDTNSGQFWVRNDTVQKPMFTDDAGRDHNLIAEFDEQTSDSTVNNTTTLAATQINFSNIPTGHYRIDMLVLLRDVAVTGCGARVEVQLSGADPDSVMRVVNKNFSGAGAPSYDEVGLVGDLFDNMPLVTGSGTSRFMFSGLVEFISGTNSFNVEFAQNTAQAGDLDFESGSWCSLTRVGP